MKKDWKSILEQTLEETHHYVVSTKTDHYAFGQRKLIPWQVFTFDTISKDDLGFVRNGLLNYYIDHGVYPINLDIRSKDKNEGTESKIAFGFPVASTPDVIEATNHLIDKILPDGVLEVEPLSDLWSVLAYRPTVAKVTSCENLG